MATSPAARSQVETAPSRPLLLELIVADLHWTAVQIGMLLALCADARPNDNLRTARHLVYNDASVMQLALRYAEAAGLEAATHQALSALYGDLGRARVQTAPFMEVAALTASQADQLKRAQLAWRKLAVSAVAALRLLEPAARSLLHPNYLVDAGAIRQFLERAAQGDLRGPDGKGAVAPPALKQRRQSPRAAVRKPCRLLFAGGDAPATLVDVSREGLGLVCDAPLAMQADVVVEVDARRLEGVVVRRVGDQLGLKLRKPLFLSDPLYRAA